MIDTRSPDFRCTPSASARPRFAYAPRDAHATDTPAVSIVTPFFNPGAEFEETARTILGQSLQSFEWIIVNDASTDPVSLAALDRVRGIPRVRVIDLQQNGGPGRARNAGFRAARAEHVFQFDSDDLLEPTALEKLLWTARCRPQLAFVNAFQVGFGAKEYLWTHGFHSTHMLTSQCPLSTHALVSKAAFDAVGGYDESIRGGMEDWEFWLRAASSGRWGVTVPEFLSWYRRRPCHSDRWSDWDRGQREREFHARMADRFPALFAGELPTIPTQWQSAYEDVRERSPVANPLAKDKPRLLMIVPWLRMGGADKWNLDLTEQLTRRGWEVSIAATLNTNHNWAPEFARYTPDIFCLANFLRPPDYPAFLRHLIESRRPDVVLVTNSELGYLVLPYLRAACPEPIYADYVHMEEPQWKNGGYGRYCAASQDQLDLSMVTSEHLKRWLGERGVAPHRVHPVYIGVDPERWKPDRDLRARVRAELGIDDDRCMIYFAGRLTRQKQPRVLAATLRELRDRGADFTAVVAGDGEDRAWLERFIDDFGLRDRVMILGEVSAQRTRELMRATDIFFLPSLWEGIALVLYEAMAAEVAYVGAMVGGHAELAPPGTAVLLPRADEAEETNAYAQELERLIRDPNARRALGAAAGKRIREGFTLDDMGDSFLEGIRMAAEFRRREPRATLPAGLALEVARRGVEYMRASDLGELLWYERDQLRVERDALAARLNLAPAPAPPAPDLPLDPAPHDPARAELTHIMNSRSWRLVESLKSNTVYRTLATIRFGEGWEIQPNEPAHERLARIKNSRSYRLIQSLKSTRAYRSYARKKYGV